MAVAEAAGGCVGGLEMKWARVCVLEWGGLSVGGSCISPLPPPLLPPQWVGLMREITPATFLSVRWERVAVDLRACNRAPLYLSR